MLKVQNMCHIIIQHFWILSKYFLNIILICWKYKTMSYSLFNIFEYYPYIFVILFVYIVNAKQVSYSLFSYIYFWILSVYFWNLIRIYWKCKTCVIFIIQHFWILLEYFLNLIRIWWTCKTGVIFIIQLYTFLNIICIFSESYSYILKIKNSIKIVYDMNIITIWNKKKYILA